MASKRASSRPRSKPKAEAVSATSAGIVKVKPKKTTVRRLKNGLIDVSFKAAEHANATKSNAESPLLRLPAELRNRIWDLVLGGNMYEVISFSVFHKFYIEEMTAISRKSFPEYTHALMQVCRQIYAETALLPFSINSFRFVSKQAFEWACGLPKMKIDLIKNVHIIDQRTYNFGGHIDCINAMRPLLKAFPVKLFPSLEKVVIECRGYTRAGEWPIEGLSEEEEAYVESIIDMFTDYIHEERPDAFVVLDQRR